MSNRTRRHLAHHPVAARFGGAVLFFLFALVILIVVGAAFLGLFVGSGEKDTGEAPLLATATRGLFQHAIVEQGQIESSNSIDVRCEVRARAGSGPPGPATTILDVIPEGSLVQKGDWLVTFDSSTLEQEKLAEQIIRNTMEANMIDAKAVYETALIDKEEFQARGLSRININISADDRLLSSVRPTSEASPGRGSAPPNRAPDYNTSASSAGTPAERNPTPQPSSPPSTASRWDAQEDSALAGPIPLVNPSYGELKRFVENEIFVADDTLRKAQLSFDSMKRKVARGLVDRLQLESESFRLRAAQNVKDLAEQKLAALENYTKQRILVQLSANFESADVSYRSAKRSYEEQQAKVKEIDDQIVKCRVVAPSAGQVVYKNVQSGRAGSEFVVEPGAAVRENQVIISLPDPSEMQVNTLVDEAQINLVRVGMPATVRIDALDSIHQGAVTKVNKYAESTNWFGGGTGKQYLTLVRLADFPPNIRVGFTAEVRMLVEERPEALQLPFQTVHEQGGKTFCLVERGNRWETKEIVISAKNGNMVVLDETASDSIREGDRVVMSPRNHLDLFDHSRFPLEETEQNEKATPPNPAQAG